MSAHPVTLEMLADWLEGRLTPEAHQQVEHHLAGCAHCRAELAWLQRFLRAARAEPLPEPPAELVRRAQALYERRPACSAVLVSRSLIRTRVWVALAVVVVLVIAAVVWVDAVGKEGSAVVAPAAAEDAVALVEAKGEESMPWRTLLPAESLPSGSRLRVAQGSAQVSLFDGSFIRVEAGTELKLTHLQRRPLLPAGRQVVIEQSAGSAEYAVQPAAVPWAEFQVRVPAGSIIVRGTRFRVEVQDQERARVRVVEGVVEVVGEVDRAEVSLGYEAVLMRGAPVMVTPAQGVPPSGKERHEPSVPPTAPPAAVPSRPEGTPTRTPGPERTPEICSTPFPSAAPSATPTRNRRRPEGPLPTPTGGEPPTAGVTRPPLPTGTPVPRPTVMPRPTMPTREPWTPTPAISPWPTRAPGPTLAPTMTPRPSPTRRHGPGPQPTPGWTPISPWPPPTAEPPAWTPGPWPTPEPTVGFRPTPGTGTPQR
ncbi:MAG: FecR domain-containing protein [Anaerolineae bacterium]